MNKKSGITGIVLSFLLISTAGISAQEYQDKLIEHFNRKDYDIEALLEDDRFELVPQIREKFVYSAEKKMETFQDYQEVLNYDRKKDLIPEFAQTYSKALKHAEDTYGIPREVIIGILGVESEFGTYSGKYNPFNAYVSMYAADYRSKFALAQLEELVEWADKNKVDVFELKSSYAGAMSYAQFIPYSLNRWFVGTELYDMENNIYSVANYLAHFKSRTGSLEKAILKYNNSSLYQQAVLSLADDARLVLE